LDEDQEGEGRGQEIAGGNGGTERTVRWFERGRRWAVIRRVDWGEDSMMLSLQSCWMTLKRLKEISTIVWHVKYSDSYC